jgi:hypothetical protein
MTDKKVVIRTDVHEERFDVEVAGESIARFSYDEHGSGGMKDARTLIERLGKTFGFEVAHEESVDD